MFENNEFQRMQELAGINQSEINETTKQESMIEGISNIIQNYCEGIEHLEFQKSDLPQMVKDIIDYCKNEFID